MQAGLLRRRVLIQSRSTSVDAMGGQITTWNTVATVYAQIESTNGRAVFAGEAVQTEVTHQIVVRYQPMFADPKAVAAMRAVYNGRYFNIHASVNEAERNRQITLFCSEGLSDG